MTQNGKHVKPAPIYYPIRNNSIPNQEAHMFIGDNFDMDKFCGRSKKSTKKTIKDEQNIL